MSCYTTLRIAIHNLENPIDIKALVNFLQQKLMDELKISEPDAKINIQIINRGAIKSDKLS